MAKQLEILEDRRVLSTVSFKSRDISNLESAGFVEIADVDGDSDKDIVVSRAGFPKLIQWHDNSDGHGTFGLPSVIDESSHVGFFVETGDIDNDGDLDLVPDQALN